MIGEKNILLIGGGGHCKACIDVIEADGLYKIVGIIDVPKKKGQLVLGYSIIGHDENIEKFLKKTNNVLITVGQIKTPSLRIILFDKVKEAGGHFPVIISPKAHVSKNATVEEGTIIMHGAIVNADAIINKNCIINNLALIEHEVVIGNHVHVSTGAIINGGCKIGDRCFIGSGTVINQGVKLCNDVILGSGSLVRKDILVPGVYAGNKLKKY